MASRSQTEFRVYSSLHTVTRTHHSRLWTNLIRRGRPRHTHTHTIYAVRRVFSAGAEWLHPSPVSHGMAHRRHSPCQRSPTPTPPRISLRSACAIKPHARGGAQYAPRVERAVQAPRRVRGSSCVFAADLASTRALVRRRRELELEEQHGEKAVVGVTVVRERAD